MRGQTSPGSWGRGRGLGLRAWGLSPRAALAGGTEHQALRAVHQVEPAARTVVEAGRVLGVRVEPVGLAVAEGDASRGGAPLRVRGWARCGNVGLGALRRRVWETWKAVRIQPRRPPQEVPNPQATQSAATSGQGSAPHPPPPQRRTPDNSRTEGHGPQQTWAPGVVGGQWPLATCRPLWRPHAA